MMLIEVPNGLVSVMTRSPTKLCWMPPVWLNSPEEQVPEDGNVKLRSMIGLATPETTIAAVTPAPWLGGMGGGGRGKRAGAGGSPRPAGAQHMDTKMIARNIPPARLDVAAFPPPRISIIASPAGDG